jgi:hypothetical protein
VAVEQAEESDGEIESSSEEYDSDDPTAALIRETKREVAAESRKSRNTQTRQGGELSRGGSNGDVSLRGLQSLSRPTAQNHVAQLEEVEAKAEGKQRLYAPSDHFLQVYVLE